MFRSPGGHQRCLFAAQLLRHFVSLVFLSSSPGILSQPAFLVLFSTLVSCCPFTLIPFQITLTLCSYRRHVTRLFFFSPFQFTCASQIPRSLSLGVRLRKLRTVFGLDLLFCRVESSVGRVARKTVVVARGGGVAVRIGCRLGNLLRNSSI